MSAPLNNNTIPTWSPLKINSKLFIRVFLEKNFLIFFKNGPCPLKGPSTSDFSEIPVYIPMSTEQILHRKPTYGVANLGARRSRSRPSNKPTPSTPIIPEERGGRGTLYPHILDLIILFRFLV